MKIKYNHTTLRLWQTYHLSVPYAGLASLGPEWKCERECSPFSRIYYIVKGEGLIYLDGKEQKLTAGNSYLIPAGLTYGYCCEDSMEQLFFHVNLTHINGMDLFRGCREIYSRQVTSPEMEETVQFYLSKQVADVFRLKSILLGELAAFMKMAGIGESDRKAYSPLVEQMFYLAQNPVSSNYHVSELAESLHVSPSTLTKRFRAETGMSPGEYLTQLVISRACSLLLTDDYSIAEIARELGFSDQFYFAKYFKKQMYVSPSTYRKQMKH